MLSKEAINEFKQIYKEEYKVELPDINAMEEATKLLMLMKTIYKPIPEK